MKLVNSVQHSYYKAWCKVEAEEHNQAATTAMGATSFHRVVGYACQHPTSYSVVAD